MRPRLSIIAVAVILAGCANAPQRMTGQEAQARATVFLAAHQDTREHVRVTDHQILPVSVSTWQGDTEWIKHKMVTLNVTQPVSLAEIVKMLHRQDLNIVSTLPLDGYTYAGVGVNRTDADTALRIILGGIGLDYELDNIHHVVTIKTMGSQSWYLSVGNRRTSYSTGAGGNSGGSQPSQAGANAPATPSGGTTGTQSQAAGGSIGGSGGGSNSISAADDIWGSLRAELDSRLKVLVPTTTTAMAAPLAQVSGLKSLPPVGDAGTGKAGTSDPTTLTLPTTVPSSQGEQALFTTKIIGQATVNPDTGTVTVQAPHWILAELDDYMKRVQEKYNTSITFSGEIVMLTTDASKSEGLDIASFGTFARSNLNLAVSNNALGGVTVNIPSTGIPTPSIATGQPPVANTLIGLSGLSSGLQVFNAYLSNLGKVQVIQKPVVSATTGSPSQIKRSTTVYFNSVSQNAAGGGVGNAAVATQNTLVPKVLGLTLRVNPFYDISTGLIRAQIHLSQTVRSGTQNVLQSLTSGNGVQQIPVPIPLTADSEFEGEVIVRDGDIVVVGGQTDDNINSTDGGVTNLKDGPLSPLFGQRTETKTQGVFYFALHVTTSKNEPRVAMAGRSK